MSKNKSLFFRVLLFLAGAGIIVLAFFLSKGSRLLSRTDNFVWTSIGLMYLIFFLPFFFSAINISNFSGKIPVLSMVWLGVILYFVASAVVILLLLEKSFISLPLNAAIVIQAILLFLFLITVYFAYFASSHTGKVAAEENTLRQYISDIKSKAQSLSLLADRLPAEEEKAKKTLKQTLEDIKYIYPVNGSAGRDLELKILRSLDMVSQLCGSVLQGAHTALEPETLNLQMLVSERKTLRN